MKKAAKVFLIIGAITGWWTVVPLVVCIKNVKRINKNVPITTGKKVVVLLFCNVIAGILLLCDRSDSQTPVTSVAPVSPVEPEPIPEPVTETPETTEAPAVKAQKLPVAALIFAVLALLIQLGKPVVRSVLPLLFFDTTLGATIQIASFITGSLCFAGLVVFIIGLLLYKKKGHIICGIALLLQAISAFFAMVTDSGAVVIICDLLIFIFLLISGIFYFTRAKVLGSPLKLIFGIIAIICVLIIGGQILRFIPILTGINLDFLLNSSPDRILNFLQLNFPYLVSVVGSIIGLGASVFSYLSVILYTPKK